MTFLTLDLKFQLRCYRENSEFEKQTQKDVPMTDLQTAPGAVHSKTISWTDPAATSVHAATMSGLDFLQAMADGRIPAPPISSHVNLEFVSVEPGEVVFGSTPDESHYNPIGSVHGGYFATLLDSAAGCAVQSTLPAGMAYTSLEIKVNFIRGMTAATGPVHVRGWVTKPGTKAAFAEAEIRDGAGRLLASASSTCLVFPTA
jgi:uncharacterized protein (TIGR00369 family)